VGEETDTRLVQAYKIITTGSSILDQAMFRIAVGAHLPAGRPVNTQTIVRLSFSGHHLNSSSLTGLCYALAFEFLALDGNDGSRIKLVDAIVNWLSFTILALQGSTLDVSVVGIEKNRQEIHIIYILGLS